MTVRVGAGCCLEGDNRATPKHLRGGLRRSDRRSQAFCGRVWIRMGTVEAETSFEDEAVPA